MIVLRPIAGTVILLLFLAPWPIRSVADLFWCYQNGQLSTRNSPASGCTRVVYSTPKPPARKVQDNAASVESVDIAKIQRQLTKLGYSPGPADGQFGQQTSSAIRAYQTDRGLRVDGQISTSVAVALELDQRRGDRAVQSQSQSQ